MVETRIEYLGELRCTAEHGPSRASILTDAPVDNHGRGEAFSPTDLVGTALGSCVLTIMGIAAEKHGIDMAGTFVTVEKEMAADPHRRIAKLSVTVDGLPTGLAERSRKLLEAAGRGCPVHHSLHPNTELVLEFCWPDQTNA